MLGINEPEVGNSTVGHLRGIREVVKLAGNDITKIGRLEASVDRELFQSR